MPSVSLRPGLSIQYLEQNPSGSPTVLLLHGLGATGESWGFQFPALAAAGYRILAPDARGFGKSTCPNGQVSIAEMASDMAHLLQMAGVNKAHVVGISMGGTIALQMACDYAKHIDRLVLVNTFARLRPARPSAWVYFAFRFFLIHTTGLKSQARAVARRLFPRPDQEELRQILFEQVVQADPRAYRAAMRSLARFNLTSRLEEITVPTLVISGEADSTVSLANQILLVEHVANARHEIIQNAGHAVIADQPEAFNKALINFLKADSF